MPRTFIAIAVACVAFSAAAGEIVRWKDADGRVHYGDKPPPDVATKSIAAPRTEPARASSDVRVEESVLRYYDIAGTTLAELNAATRLSGPVSKTSGLRVWGMCTWNVTWTYTRLARPGSCSLEKFAITVGATIDMPRWINRDSAAEDVRSRWDRFLVALRLHEDGHKDNGVRAANDLANRLRAVKAEKTCAELDQKIVAMGERVLSEYRLADQAYDRSTDHGVTQGAVLK